MCVIICRDPGIEIPHDKLESASIVNPDGYGISIIDRGKLETIKEAVPNKAATIIKRLEDAKDHKVFLHLRFKTHGDINLDNCHPFTVYADDTRTINMMHNGVISDFSSGYNGKFSDTFHFNESILKPIVSKLLPYHLAHNTSVLDDETLLAIVEKYCGYSNKVVLYDNNDSFMIANRSRGVEFDGWWASNDYSFNERHRTPTTTYYKGGTHGGRSSGVYSFPNDDLPWQNDPNYTPPTVTSSTKKDAKASAKTASSSAVSAIVSTASTTAKYVNPTIVPPQMRDTFIEMIGISKLEQLTVMEQEDIEEIVTEFPEAATVLIMDLLYELYIKDKNAKQLEAGIGKL